MTEDKTHDHSFENVQVKNQQEWKGQSVYFEEDSSPAAWEHFRKVYSVDQGICKIGGKEYNFENIAFCNYYENFEPESGLHQGKLKDGKYCNYLDYPCEYKYFPNYPCKYKLFPNRLYAVLDNAVCTTGSVGNKEIAYYRACLRLGGECDFNFNDEKYNRFKFLIEHDKTINQHHALEQLERCHGNHHKLVNFSLMQVMGNMQGFKGEKCDDRLDAFVLQLAKHYEDRSIQVHGRRTSKENQECLEKYLNGFCSVYDYCKQIYFIDDESFVNEIIDKGGKPIKCGRDVERYMTLAEKFWNRKIGYFDNALELREDAKADILSE